MAHMTSIYHFHTHGECMVIVPSKLFYQPMEIVYSIALMSRADREEKRISLKPQSKVMPTHQLSTADISLHQ